MVNTKSARSPNPVQWFSDMLGCNLHRHIVIVYSAIIQMILSGCPTALVWQSIGNGISEDLSGLCGSPLDLLPCPPSALPTATPQNQQEAMRNFVKQLEDAVKKRSVAVELQWTTNKTQQNSTSVTNQMLLQMLDALDQHDHDRVDNPDKLDALSAQVFVPFSGNEDEVSFNQIVLIQTEMTEEILAVCLIDYWFQLRILVPNLEVQN